VGGAGIGVELKVKMRAWMEGMGETEAPINYDLRQR
jgi:hypothetical protein